MKIRQALMGHSGTKLGQSPGTLEFTGAARTDPVKTLRIDFNPQQLEKETVDFSGSGIEALNEGWIRWLDLDGVHDLELMRRIGDRANVHPLVLEDVVNTNQRPKVDEFDDYLFIVIRALDYDQGELNSEQVSLVVGPTRVVSFRQSSSDLFAPVQKRLEEGKGRLRRMGTDYLAYALVDVVVDRYFTTVESISERIEELETKLLDDPLFNPQDGIRTLHHDLILVRRAVWPVRELLSALMKSDSELIGEETQVFIRDVHDHILQIIDSVDSLREMIGVLRDGHQAILGNKMNDIMKMLTLIATVFMPLTFIAGIYGMNFENMPELQTENGYFFAIAAMLAIGAGLFAFFKWKKWM